MLQLNISLKYIEQIPGEIFNDKKSRQLFRQPDVILFFTLYLLLHGCVNGFVENKINVTIF